MSTTHSEDMPQRNAARQPLKSDVRVSTSEEAEQRRKGIPRNARKTEGPVAARPVRSPISRRRPKASPTRSPSSRRSRQNASAWPNIVLGDDTEDGFIKYGKVWAKIHDYSREDFAALGISRAFSMRYSAAERRAAPRPRSTRAPRVSTKDLADAITAKSPGTWLTVSGVMREVGGSPATVRKVLDELAAAGTVTDPIDDPKHSGKGRAAEGLGTQLARSTALSATSRGRAPRCRATARRSVPARSLELDLGPPQLIGAAATHDASREPHLRPADVDDDRDAVRRAAPTATTAGA